MKRFLYLLCLGMLNVVCFAQTPAYLNESLPLETRVKDALSRMTLEEKVALCHEQSKFSSCGVPRLGIPELWMSDGPHGVRCEIAWNDWKDANWTNDSITAFPALTCLAATWNPEMAAIFGKALGEEARYRNKAVILGPGVNIYRTPLNGRNFEYMGEDPFLSATMCVPYIQNVQSNGVAVCVKHYALNNQETWRGHINVKVSDRALYEIYLPAFKAAVTKGKAWSVMGSYNQYQQQHCCHNERLLMEILKGEWKFDGAVISDWGGTHNTYEAAMRGLDLEMGTGGESGKVFLAAPYLAMLKSGEVPISTLDDKATRMLRLLFRTVMNRQRPFGSLCTEEHYNVCREVGEEGIVLLKNSTLAKKESPLLPLNGSYNKILVVGDNSVKNLMKGGGSSELKAKRVVSPLQGLQEIYGDKVEFVQGYTVDKNATDEQKKRLSDEAIEKAKNADIVLLIGGLNKNEGQDCEGADRKEYALPYGQNELIAGLTGANPRTVVVLISGNAVEMPWVNQVPAILQAWYLGSESGHALANVLSGKVNPSGKLPFSFPVKLEDCGAHAFDALCYPGDGTDEEYKEDILVGYRWYDTKKIPALFSFGHGLSYTTFKYGKAVLSAKEMNADGSVTVTVPVTNAGTVAGKEVVQLYIGDDKCSVARPVKELKGFQKIALQPGETKEVTFTIDADALKYFDEIAHAWVAEPGKFTVYIGSSSTDIRCKASFTMN